MASVSIKEQKKIGVEVLDHDHKALEGYLISLEKALNDTSNDVGSAEAAFSELITHLKGHFQREEAWLERVKYPSLETHKRQHNTLVKSVQSFSDKFAANPSKDSGIQVFGFVYEWLVEHMNSADRVFGSYVGYKINARDYYLNPGCE